MARCNSAGAFSYQVSAVGRETTLARIVALMRAAQGTRAPIQRLADRVSAVFVPTVMAIAVVTFVVWLLVAPGGPSISWVRALSAALSVLIIACPCAMGLAVPAAIMVASGKGAQLGILIKGGEALQRLRAVDTIVLDKTGTITEGKPAVIDIVAAPDNGSPRAARNVLQPRGFARAVLQHPLGRAVVARAVADTILLTRADDFLALPGKGATGTVGGVAVAVGNAALMADLAIGTGPLAAAADDAWANGKTVMYVAAAGRLAGLITLADPIRPASRDAVARLTALGLDVVMVTGDAPRAAEAIARQAGITRVVAGVLPAGKVEEIEQLQRAGHVVGMVGDGINDAPALSAADVGIAIGTGADVAIEAADVTLLRGDLLGVPAAIALSRRTMRIIKQNLFWAFAYNVVGIPVAAGILYPIWGVTLFADPGQRRNGGELRQRRHQQPPPGPRPLPMSTPRKRTTTRHAAAATPDTRQSVAPDAGARERNLLRLRRIEGQVRGLQRMVESDRYCADVLTQIASVHEALRAVGRELMRHHLKHCATSAIRTGGPDGEAMYDELMELMYRTVR